jgi:hypothetical protein
VLNNQEKISLIIWRLNNIEGNIKSFIDHADKFQNKYSLEEELDKCNAKKQALLQKLEELGGVWQG